VILPLVLLENVFEHFVRVQDQDGFLGTQNHGQFQPISQLKVTSTVDEVVVFGEYITGPTAI
jgi:hypothetical protein